MIKFAILLEYTVVALGLIFIISQIAVPAIKRTPFFPILRKKRHVAFSRYSEAVEAQEIDAIKRETAGLSVGQNSTSAKRGAK